MEQELHGPLDVVDVVRADRPSQGDDRPRIAVPAGSEDDQSTADRILGVSQAIGVGRFTGRIGACDRLQGDPRAGE